jgi:hypothetical protein
VHRGATIQLFKGTVPALARKTAHGAGAGGRGREWRRSFVVVKDGRPRRGWGGSCQSDASTSFDCWHSNHSRVTTRAQLALIQTKQESGVEAGGALPGWWVRGACGRGVKGRREGGRVGEGRRKGLNVQEQTCPHHQNPAPPACTPSSQLCGQQKGQKKVLFESAADGCAAADVWVQHNDNHGEGVGHEKAGLVRGHVMSHKFNTAEHGNSSRKYRCSGSLHTQFTREPQLHSDRGARGCALRALPHLAIPVRQAQALAALNYRRRRKSSRCKVVWLSFTRYTRWPRARGKSPVVRDARERFGVALLHMQHAKNTPPPQDRAKGSSRGVKRPAHFQSSTQKFTV